MKLEEIRSPFGFGLDDVLRLKDGWIRDLQDVLTIKMRKRERKYFDGYALEI